MINKKYSMCTLHIDDRTLFDMQLWILSISMLKPSLFYKNTSIAMFHIFSSLCVFPYKTLNTLAPG